MQYVIVRGGVVQNIVDWDGGPSWAPPADTQAHRFDGVAGIGWQWNDGAPIDPAPPPPPPPPPPDWSDVQVHGKHLVAVMLAVANMTGQTPAQARAAFRNAWNSLP